MRDITRYCHNLRRTGYTTPTRAGRSSWALPPARVISRVPTRWLCSSEWVTHMIALTVFSGLRSIDKVYVSTASIVSGSRADVGSRSAGNQKIIGVDVSDISTINTKVPDHVKKTKSDPIDSFGEGEGEWKVKELTV